MVCNWLQIDGLTSLSVQRWVTDVLWSSVVEWREAVSLTMFQGTAADSAMLRTSGSDGFMWMLWLIVTTTFLHILKDDRLVGQIWNLGSRASQSRLDMFMNVFPLWEVLQPDPHSGVLRTQNFRSPLLRTRSCQDSPLKAWSRSENSPACFAYCQEFLPF